MPLSDHEQRLLEQMERALYAEDPKFADSLRKTRGAAIDRGRMILGILGALAGLGLLLAGVASSLPLLGLLGFLALVAGAFVSYQAFSAQPEQASSTPGAPPAAPGQPSRGKPRAAAAQSGSSFMDRLEERWRKRREQGGQF